MNCAKKNSPIQAVIRRLYAGLKQLRKIQWLSWPFIDVTYQISSVRNRTHILDDMQSDPVRDLNDFELWKNFSVYHSKKGS